MKRGGSHALACLALAMLGAGAAAAAPKASARFLLVGERDEWRLLNLRDGKTRPVQLPEELSVEDAAVSPDGTLYAFIVNDRASRSTRLALWRGGDTAVERVGEDAGYYGEPRFSADGQTLYFVHNANGRGKPMGHLSRAFAQLYRIHADGTGFEALSDENGCHFAPVSESPKTLFYLHTDCHRSVRWVESLDLETRAKKMVSPLKGADDLMLSPDGTRAVWLVRGVNVERVNVTELATHKSVQTVVEPKSHDRLRAAWLDKETFYFSIGLKVWKVSGFKATLTKDVG